MGLVVVVGSVNADMVARVRRAPEAGETVLCDTYFTAAGGKGANQAVAAARMGAEVTFAACVGRDALGESAVAGFQEDGIGVSLIEYDPDLPTGTAFIWVEESGENRIVVASGANAALSPEQIDRAAAVIRAADVLLVQLESPLNSVARALQIARDAGVRTVLNPAPAQAVEFLGLVDILTPNAGEAERLLGLKPGAASPEDLPGRLLASGVGAVCMTRGERGALVQTRGQAARAIPAPAVTVVDTTAAGDTFSGAIAAGLAEGLSLEAAAELAVTAASLACTTLGAQPSIPGRGQVLAHHEPAEHPA